MNVETSWSSASVTGLRSVCLCLWRGEALLVVRCCRPLPLPQLLQPPPLLLPPSLLVLRPGTARLVGVAIGETRRLGVVHFGRAEEAGHGL